MKLGWWLMIAMIGFEVGCSKTSSPTDPAAAASSETSATARGNSPPTLEPPAVALAQFLEALRAGNDEQASGMLTPVARQGAAASNRKIMPCASDTAKFSVDKVKYIAHDGAQVTATWTDVGQRGEPVSDKAVWVLRKETEGWRVAGVAWEAFPNEPPVLFDFENLADLEQKQNWIKKEQLRRQEDESLQARDPEHGEGAVRR
jgi:hypothetical protein